MADSWFARRSWRRAGEVYLWGAVLALCIHFLAVGEAVAAEPAEIEAATVPLYGTCTLPMPNGLPPITVACSGDNPKAVTAKSGTVSIQSISNSTVDAVLSRLDYQRVRGWIVLWNNVSQTTAACKEAESTTTGRFNGTCTARFSTINGFTGQFTDQQLYLFLRSFKSAVASVHEDTLVFATSIQNNPIWALDRLDQADLPLDSSFKYYNNGTGVNVYIVDSGIRTTHTQFKYGDGTPGSRATEVFSSVGSGVAGQDCNGHGTHVAGSVGGLTFGVAKNVSLRAVRVLECAGNGTVSQVITGLQWIQQNYKAPAVVAIALGGDPQYALDLAVDALVKAGITVVVAAGNEDTDACKMSPGRSALATTVAATTKTDERLWVAQGVASNYGPCVDIWAPGYQIESASSSGDTNTEIRSGTSQSVPFVTGAIALYLQNNTGASPADVNSDIVASGSWNRIRENSNRGTYNQDILRSTPNVMAQIDLDPSLILTPDSLEIKGPADGFGPYNISVSLARRPIGNRGTGTVNVYSSVSDQTRGRVSPLVLTFDASNWNIAQQVTLSVSDYVYSTVATQDFFVNFFVQSSDATFDGRRPLLRVDDRKGDTIYYPKAILSLPFSDQSSTFWFQDDYNVECAPDSGGSPDVAYYFMPKTSMRAYISLCASKNLPDAFDTKLAVFSNVDLLGTAKLEPTSCNDDSCGYLSELAVDMVAGVAYAIVVDGASGAEGSYQIDITTDAQGGLVKGSAPPRVSGKNSIFSQNSNQGSAPTWTLSSSDAGPMPPTATPTSSPPPPASGGSSSSTGALTTPTPNSSASQTSSIAQKSFVPYLP